MLTCMPITEFTFPEGQIRNWNNSLREINEFKERDDERGSGRKDEWFKELI